MKLCIPVTMDSGMDSPVSAHFGSAPMFMVVDTDSGDASAVNNNNQHHQHGMCQPLAALAGIEMDAIVVGGIGMGALSKLMSAGIKVYLAEHPTVGQTVDAYKRGVLGQVDPSMACGGHTHGHGCGH
ncbi:MAG TPA: NifB/NifX family molybdenum-iron cluster-binding protein [Myxococcota bacterium]|nr:NifB/NifX family molybdenum-iron cluster-binding protein [Myxococcota bacterium]HNZ03720.1 NifB/NifX family molybdenum-iron cluster-binding protein [Myxococcota bacterium]HOD08402.1 NifB/NifX family molybdenum-iron cluster-binding protein [Myxococcota bacterium]